MRRRLRPRRIKGKTMPRKTGRALSATFAALTISVFLTSCAAAPKIEVTADTSCETFRYLPVSDAQHDVFAENMEVMRPLAQDIVQHNRAYTGKCLQPAKGE